MIVPEMSRFHRKFYNKVYFAIGVFFTLCLGHLLWDTPDYLYLQVPTVHYYAYQVDDMSCRTFTKKDWRNFPKPKKTHPSNGTDKTIFFHETSCKGGLTSREACAIESAAKAHPDWVVKVFFFGPVHKMFLKGTMYRTLQALPNVIIARVNLEAYAEGTILESFYRSDRILLKSYHKAKNLLELLKFLTLYHNGGVYLDLDMIVVNSFNNLPKNWASRQSATEMGAGAIAFSNDGIGRKMANETMQYIRQIHKNGKILQWQDSSSKLLTLTLKKNCLTNNVSTMNAANCLGLDIYDKNYFYPTESKHWGAYSMPTNFLTLLDTYSAYTHKTWSSLSSGYIFDSGTKLAKLAQMYCPKVYKLYEEDFGV